MKNILKCPKCGRIVIKGTAIKNMDYWICHNPKCEIKYLNAPPCYRYGDLVTN